MKNQIDGIGLEARREISDKMRADNPGKVPIVLRKGKGTKLVIPNSLFLVSEKRTVGEFLYSIRKSLKLRKNDGLYLFVSDRLPSLNMTVLQIYERLADDDGFLYFTYTNQEDKGFHCNIILQKINL